MKIKTIFLIFCILLATTWCEAASVTQANMRISAVDGTAFTDFSAAGTLTPYIGWYVKVYDSTNKSIEGYIKAAGTGETFNNYTAWANDPRGGTLIFETFTTSGMDIISAINTTGVGICNIPVGVQGELVKTTYTMTLNSGNMPITRFGNNPIIEDMDGERTAVSGSANTIYRTNKFANTYFSFLNLSGTTGFSATSSLVAKVLTPSTTGVTIVSTLNGTLYNWAVQTSGFNYNDSSGYTYTLTATGFTGSTTGKLQ